MTNDKRLEQLLLEIDRLEKMISDTKYFIETASCKETKQMYLETLSEHTIQLEAIRKQKAELM